MKIQTSRKSFISLESVAMTDIVMNLFIFFFISFSLLYTFSSHKESQIEVKLPRGQAKEAGGAEGPFIVSVTAANQIYIGNLRILPEQLKEEFVSRVKMVKPSGVLVRADKSASVETLVKVLDSAKEAGLEKLGVAVEQA